MNARKYPKEKYVIKNDIDIGQVHTKRTNLWVSIPLAPTVESLVSADLKLILATLTVVLTWFALWKSDSKIYSW